MAMAAVDARITLRERARHLRIGIVEQPLRAAEAGRPRFADPSRPTTAVAAFPGGAVPEDIP